MAHIPIIVNDLVDGVSEAEQLSAVHGRGATDFRINWRPLYLESRRVRFSLLDTKGLDMSADQVEAALKVDVDEWRSELPKIAEHFTHLGERVPAGVIAQVRGLEARLSA